MRKKAVIFDLDGVIVSTDECHYQAWQRMADDEDIYFDRSINENLRGVSRMASLEIILKRSEKAYTDDEKAALAQRKNTYYRDLLNQVTPDDMLPGVMPVLQELRARGIKMAIGSSSKNAPCILEKVGLHDWFDAVADGNGIKNSKPDPEVFLLAATMLEIVPEACVVVEDADSGIEAALAGGMKAVGVGSASRNPNAHYAVPDLSHISVDELIA